MSTIPTVTIGGEAKRVEPVSARKASRALAILRTIGNEVPELVEKWQTVKDDFRQAHAYRLTRVEARLNYPPQPLIDQATGAPLREPEVIRERDEETGELVVKPNPRAGELVILPSPIEHMTEDDWRESDNVLTLPREPRTEEVVWAIIPEALELAEEHIARVLALFLMPNEEVKRRRKDGSLDEALTEQAEDLLDDALGDELLELATVAGELVSDQFIGKARELGERMGNALRLVGVDPTALASRMNTNTPMTSTPESSTDGPDGSAPPTTSSTPPTSSSGDSETSTTNGSPPNERSTTPA